MDTLPTVAFYLKDAEGRIMALNPRNCEICNVHDESEAIGKRSSNLFPSILDAEASPRDDWARLQPAIRHLEQNYAERTSIAACARLAHMSETNFRRRFKQTLGCTPLEFLTSVRLATARKLLATTDRCIADIALETGFCDHAHFIRVFRVHRKTTPGAYRRRHQKRH